MIKYGDSGTNFYIIVKGSVSVMVPNQSIKKWRQKRYEFLQDQEWYISILKKYKNLISEQKKVHDLNSPGRPFIK